MAFHSFGTADGAEEKSDGWGTLGMKHYGDITKLSGYTLPIVDVITGGSPCQDLSVAGKRAGLDGQRSGLFMEQIRIVKEMRERDRKENGRANQFIRPRYCIWENVPGAFSSNKGKDFQAVLTEFARIADPDAPDVPMPEKGKWPKAGCIYDEMGEWSIAWRVHDAQFWGVPQRRKRISLVADFGGLSAPEILFERKGLSRDSEQGETQRKETAGSTGSGSYPAIARSITRRYDGSPCIDREPDVIVQGALNPWDSQSERVYPDSGVWHSLNANENGGQSRDSVFCLQGNGIDRADTAGGNGAGWCKDVSYTLNTIDRPAVCAGFKHKASGLANGIGYEEEKAPSLIAGQESAVYDARGNGNGETVPTLTGDHQNRVTDYTALCVGNGQLNQISMAEQANTLDTMHDQQAFMVSSIVRRLTPLEAERLQGYPDGWTDIGDWTDSKGKQHKAADSPRYKALGNSIALPFWQYLARRICAQYERDITMGSLFDGIGGFPLVFERCGAKAVWASEIEEFPIAVTKKHFPEETTL